MKWVRLLLAGLAVATLLLSGCRSGGPQERTINMEIKHGKLTGEKLIRVNQGDTVTLRWSTDEPAGIHLHGYDIEKTLSPGETTQMTFTADATGKFDITLHPAEEDEHPQATPGQSHNSHAEAETVIASLEVHPR